MVRRMLGFLLAIAGGAWAAAVGDPALLLHYAFDEGGGARVQDLSGHGLGGQVSCRWIDSPSGKAVFMDGTAKGIVRVTIPENLRFGRGSWTFSAWLNPKQFAIKDRQNQRRVFAFGNYPEAYLVIDLTGTGALSCYFCYKNAAGKIISTGASSAVHLRQNEWSHVALVCDREAGRIWPYVNGYCRNPAVIRPDFDGNFVLGGELTLGNSWHNYWGAMDEVRIYRRALERAEIRKEFLALKATFGAKESAEAVAMAKHERYMAMFAEVRNAWVAGDVSRVRKLCEALIASSDLPVMMRGYAHLRLAQSYADQGDRAAALKVYEALEAQSAYPAVQRMEAGERIRELRREVRGLPPRDPAASRTAIPDIEHVARKWFVSVDGDDRTGDGSRDKPLATVTRARDAIRAFRKRGGKGTCCVTLLPGTYRLRGPVELGPEDSGSAEAPVVYRALKRGSAILYGGRRIQGFSPVRDPDILKRLPAEARAKVMQCDIRALGITDYGRLQVRGFGQPPSPPTLEVYFDGKPLTLARWPNEGFVGIRSLVDPGSKAKGTPAVIEYDSDRHERWLQAKDIWLFGYFRYLWADAAIKVGAIDPKTHTLTTAAPYLYGNGGMSTRQGIQYYAFNLLEEIDRPGEWYLDRDSGVLYLYPPSDPNVATVEIGMLSTPMLTMTGCTDIRLENLVFDLARYNGLVLRDCSRCLIAGCTVSRMAGNGITIRGGRRNGLQGCDIFLIGRRATEVIGGDRKTLTPGEHRVENCRIHDFGRIDRTYTPAIQLEGVGHHVTHNLMYNCPSSVMRIEGNDHLIEYNEVYHAVRESDDQGAMELFRNATYRGVVFRYNLFRDVGKHGHGASVHGQAAIRLDDAISGMLLYGNVFIRSANGHFGAVQMNSGRDNIIDNNLFIECKQGISGGWNPGNSVWKILRAGRQPENFYTSDLYLSRYPALGHMLEGPGINHLWRNVFYRCGQVARSNRAYLDMFQNEVFKDEDPGFVDAAGGDYRLRADAVLFQRLAFYPIPIGEIGLYESRYRHRISGTSKAAP